jgi:integrase
MALGNWKHVHRDVDRYGRVRFYFRIRGKQKIRLPDDIESEEFALAYFAARNGEAPGAAKPVRPRQGTFAFIARSYLLSPEFRALNRLTRTPRERLLDKLVAQIGHMPAAMDPGIVRRAIKDRRFAAGKELLSALRAVYRHAIEEELVATDPTVGARRKPNTSEGHRTWTAEDCALYEARWTLGTQARTAYALGLYTAQRISDAVRIGRPHEKDGRLRFTQAKNEKVKPVFVDIPIAPPLRAALDAWQGKGLTYLETEAGKPYKTGKGLQNKVREWCKEAGVHPKCSFHGLRKAAAARLAEAGCTPHQIMAVLGHSTHQQAATYTAKAERAGLATDALALIYGSPQPPIQLGQEAPKTLTNKGFLRPLAVPRGDAST